MVAKQFVINPGIVGQQFLVHISSQETETDNDCIITGSSQNFTLMLCNIKIWIIVAGDLLSNDEIMLMLMLWSLAALFSISFSAKIYKLNQTIISLIPEIYYHLEISAKVERSVIREEIQNHQEINAN